MAIEHAVARIDAQRAKALADRTYHLQRIDLLGGLLERRAREFHLRLYQRSSARAVALIDVLRILEQERV